MRKRLYQALPENSALIDSVLETVEDKTKKRFYAQSTAAEKATSATVSADCSDAVSGILALAEQQLDILYALGNWYEKEWAKNSLSMYPGWHVPTSPAVKCYDWYMDCGKAAWKTGYGLAFDSAKHAFHHLFPFMSSR